MNQAFFFRALRHMNLRAVSEASGIHRNTLYSFMQGRSKLSPETIEKLRVYLESRGVVISG